MKKYRYSILELTRRLLVIARPQRKLIFFATMASIIGNLAHMGLMGFGSALVLFCAGRYFRGSVLLWGGMTLLSAVLIGVMRFIEGVDSHASAYNLLADMRVSLFHKLHKLAPACLVDREKGDVLSVAVADIDTIENFFAHTIGPMFTVILLPLTALLYAGGVHWLFAAALFPVYAVISIVLPLLAMKAGRNIGIAYRMRIGDMKSFVLESVYGLRDIQIFRLGNKRLGTVVQKGNDINNSAHALTAHRQIVSSLPTFFIYLSRILIVFIAGWLGSTGQVNVAKVIILSFVVAASFSSTQSLITVVTSLLEAYAAAARYFEIQDTVPAVMESDNAVPIETIESIAMENVQFQYQKENEPVLEGTCLQVKKGEKIGIIGESGSGKSTILRLLLRFWDPDSGSIKVNGTDLKAVCLKDLRRHMAMLEQSTYLYNDTVKANIAVGKPEATLEEIARAAKRAGIHNLIETLPNGYDTELGEHGNRLSGGEKQRIGIARIFLTEPDVIVMDEPTSSLDVFNEKKLLKTLEEGYQDQTVILVSHRASTLTGCDELYRLQDGRLEKI